MTPDDREFGELIGEVKAIGSQLVEMRSANSAEHASVERHLTEIRAALATKADTRTIQTHEQRIDSLEKTRDEGSGAARAIRVAQGVGLFILAALPFLIFKGGVA
jgi:hypothetical protein